MKATALLIATLLTGCAGSMTYSHMIESGGALRVAEPDDSTHQYKFYIKTFIDFGVDTKRPEDRLTLIKGYLGDSCPTLTLVSETYLPHGNPEDKVGTYVAKVRCK